jgi:hypothetical protein
VRDVLLYCQARCPNVRAGLDQCERQSAHLVKQQTRI